MPTTKKPANSPRLAAAKKALEAAKLPGAFQNRDPKTFGDATKTTEELKSSEGVVSSGGKIDREATLKLQGELEDLGVDEAGACADEYDQFIASGSTPEEAKFLAYGVGLDDLSVEQLEALLAKQPQ